jgi:excisionase family DNA binding protein
VEILTVPEIAEQLRISETQVYRLIHDGHLKAVNAGVRRRVVARAELDDFIRRGGVAC